MTVNYTSLLGLGQPVTGTESGTWGDDVNNAVTSYIDIAVAGTQTLSTDADVTLSLTQGTSTATNIGSTTAQYAILNCTGARTVQRNINVPNSSKTYIVLNQTTGGFAVKIRGTTGPTTGVTVANGRYAVVSWAGSDFVVVSTNDINSLTGTLAVGGGGTGLTSGTSGGVLYYSASGTLASSAALAANAIVLGGGAGAAPASTTTGTGVVNALGINVGTAGAFIVNGGALGTPSSGTLTSCAGLPISTGVSGLGTNVATALAVNVGTAGAVVVNGGVLGTPSSGTLSSCSGLPISTGVSGLGTGVATALANNADATSGFATTNGTATLSSKRINPRVVAAAATSGNLTINGDTTDLYKAESLSGAITFLTPSGTPVDGQKIIIRLKDDGTARGITWTTSVGAFRAVGITLPTTTTLSKVTYVGCIYNATDTYWDAIATVTQA